MNDTSGAGRRCRYGPRRAGLRQAGRRRSGAVAALAATALLAAACGGGSRPAGSDASPAQEIVQKMAVFAKCMRSHGEPNFYYSNPGSSNSSGPLLAFMGYYVSGVNPHTTRFTSAMKSCHHLLPRVPKTASQQAIQRELRFATCMRAHGYPGYPDPDVHNGVIVEHPLPSSIDTAPPQFQAAERTCNGSS